MTAYPRLSLLIRGGVVAVIVLPVVAGLLVTFSMALGYFPALGGLQLSLKPLLSLAQQPGFSNALFRTVFTGVSATFIALLITHALLAFCSSQRFFFPLLHKLNTPLLAVPHITVILGVMYLLSSHGTFGRVLNVTTSQHIDYIFAPDPQGYAVILSLIIKEIPYLLLMSAGALQRIPSQQLIIVSQSFGYSYPAAWTTAVLPLLHKQLKLPLIAVLSFGLSSPEHNILLFPLYASGLPGLTISFYNHHDLAYQFTAAAAATSLIFTCLITILLWFASEYIIRKIFRKFFLTRGKRILIAENISRKLTLSFTFILTAIGALSFLIMLIWSFTKIWRYPQLLPSRTSLQQWLDVGMYAAPALSTLLIAALSFVISLFLALLFLEAQPLPSKPSPSSSPLSPRQINPHKFLISLFYLPLIIPQISFIFGIDIVASLLFPSTPFVILCLLINCHILFVFPYLLISLSSPYQNFDRRYSITARCLGRSYLSTLITIKWPLLKAPILFASAIGITVSFGLYLPTLVLGGGRYSTLTVETVSLASGGNLRVIALLTILQTLLSLAILALATFFSRQRFSQTL